MRWSKQVVVPLLCMVVGLAMIVTAAGIVSNTIENPNNVVSGTTAITLSLQLATDLSTTYRGSASDWVAGNVYQNQPYVMKLAYTVNAHVIGLLICFEFDKSPVNASDVQLSWTDGATVAWTAVTFSASGGTATGSFAPIQPNPAKGESANYYLSLTYTVTGAFDFKIWATGTPS